MRFPYILPLLFAASGALLVADGPSGIMTIPSSLPKVAKAARVMGTSEAQKSDAGKPTGAPKVESPYFGDIMRLPFQSHRIYKIQVVPGSPVMLELPAGESAKNMFWDTNWWTLESTPGSGRVGPPSTSSTTASRPRSTRPARPPATETSASRAAAQRSWST